MAVPMFYLFGMGKVWRIQLLKSPEEWELEVCDVFAIKMPHAPVGRLSVDVKRTW